MTGEGYEAIYRELGIARQGQGNLLTQPRRSLPLTQRRRRDGSIYFAARRADQRSFDPLLWREIEARPRRARRAEFVALRPVDGCEAAAFWQLLHGDTGHEAELALTEHRLSQRADLTATAKHDLLRARHGLGLFRQHVEQYELCCRVTGVQDRRHLKACHIKPWIDCDDAGKLDGCNGLLFSPHVGHLFDRGYLSFDDGGTLLISRHVNPAVIDRWDLRQVAPAAGFQPGQLLYLDWHRQRIFEQPEGGRRRD